MGNTKIQSLYSAAITAISYGTIISLASVPISTNPYKYVHFAALPPLFFDLENDPAELHNLAGDPSYAPLILEYAQKMISWRIRNDERTLTHMMIGPSGLVERLPQPR